MARQSPAARRRELLSRARLYLVIDAQPPGADLEAIVREALTGGVDVVQLREKEAPDDEIVAAGRLLRRLCDAHEALLIVNDRPELALACDADGVHVGQDDAPVAEVRRAVGPDLLIGLSTHSPAQIDAAGASPADYLGVGPVYETATKPGVAAVGEGLVAYAAAHATKPFFAIGGIDAGNVGRVARAGARRVAVVRAIRDAADPRRAAAALSAGLDEGGGHGGRSEPDASSRPSTSRSETRDAAARAQLRPLCPGERPAAVTVAAVVALALVLANVALFLAGGEPSLADRAMRLGQTLQVVLPWEMWRARYWAVLAMQGLLGILIVLFSLFLLVAENMSSALLALAVVVAAGALFWALVKAMARLQMPLRK